MYCFLHDVHVIRQTLLCVGQWPWCLLVLSVSSVCAFEIFGFIHLQAIVAVCFVTVFHWVGKTFAHLDAMFAFELCLN